MNKNDEPLTIEKINEAKALIEALAPPKAPENTLLLQSTYGLKIMKNPYLANDIIIVSTNLFDIIFNATEQPENDTAK